MMDEQKVVAIVNRMLQQSQYKIGGVPFHTHNGIDSYKISTSSAAGSSLTTTGLATKLLGTGAGTQTIAHGFGSKPAYARVTGFSGTGSTLVAGVGTFDGTNQQFSCIYGTATPTWGTGDILQFSDGSGNTIQAVASLDATNLTLTWSVTGSNTFSAQFHFIWECS